MKLKKIITLLTVSLLFVFALTIPKVKAETNDILGILNINDTDIEIKKLTINVETDIVELRAIDSTDKEKVYALHKGQEFSLNAENSRVKVLKNNTGKEYNSLSVWGIKDDMGLEYRLLYNNVLNQSEQEHHNLNFSEQLEIIRVGNANIVYYDLLDGAGPKAMHLAGEEREKHNLIYPYKDNKMFMGWYIDSELTQELQYPFNITGDLILYAKYQDLSEETVNINFINFSEQTPNYETLTIDKGIVFDLEYFKPVKTDKIFVGWYLDEELETPLEKNHVFNEDTTIYAKYEDIYHRVKFYTGNTLYSNFRVKKYSIVSAPAVAPEKDGYEFIGWYLNDKPFDFNTEIVSDLRLEAKFKRVDSVLITYHYNNDNDDVVFKEYDISKIGSKLELPVLAWKELYKFIGWYLDEELTQEVNIDKIPDYNLNLYAKWEYGGKIRIVFETDGGDVIDDWWPIIPTEKLDLPIPKKAGFNFGGWYLDSDFTYEAPTIALTDMILYAKWEERVATTPDSLPLTADNKLGTVSFRVIGNRVETDIYYNNMYYSLNHTFDISSDFGIFNTKEAYYINLDGTPQIFINHSDRLYLKDILEAKPGEKPAFVPHTIWDLNTNELTTRNQYTTNAYIKQNDKGLLISYVYIDEFIIDKINSAIISWTSRQKNNFLGSILLGKYTDWETLVVEMTGDEEFKYRNLTSSWQDIIPYWNVISATYKLNKHYELPRINSVDFNQIQPEYNITKTEVESYFRSINDNFDKFNLNPRYKLWAFTLQEGKNYLGIQTEIYNNPNDLNDEKNFKILNLQYTTNGKLYETVGDDIEIKTALDPTIDGIKNQKESKRPLIIFIVVSALYALVLLKTNAFKSSKKFIETSLVFFGFLLLIAVVYYYAIPALLVI